MNNTIKGITLMLLIVTSAIKPLCAKEITITLTSLMILPNSYQMEVGETFDFQVFALDKQNLLVGGSTVATSRGFVKISDKPLYYEFPSPSNIIQIADNNSQIGWGFSVKALEIGSASIKAELGKLTAIAKIIVVPRQSATIETDQAKYPLHYAALNRDINNLREALEKGVDIDSKNEDGMTALYIAAFIGHLETAQILIDNGATTNLRDNEGYTALGIAKKRNNEAVYNYLLNYECRMKIKKKVALRSIKQTSGAIIQSFIDCPD